MKRLFSFLMNLLRKSPFSQDPVIIPNNKDTTNYNRSELIEPHGELLKKPDKGTFLYKIIPSKFFLEMIGESYLYFSKVDTYDDDKRDSDQPDIDKEISRKGKFQGDTDKNVSDYYHACRSKTYACCFSTKQTKRLWEHYGNNDRNAVCLVFDCDQLIDFLNSNFNSGLFDGNQVFENPFYINYGLVTYGDFDEGFLKVGLPCPNPIEYVYFKDAGSYQEEHEFRVSLSCSPGTRIWIEFNFFKSIKLVFDFVKAVERKVLKKIKFSETCEVSFKEELIVTLGRVFSSEQIRELLD